MLSSRLFWKLLVICVGLSLLAGLVFGRVLTGWWLAAALAVAVAALAYWIWVHVVRPVASLAEASETIAAGDYQHRVYVANRDELGALAKTLNRMSQELDARMEQLGATRTRHSTVLDGMIEGVIAVDGRQRIVLANPAAGRLFDFNAPLAEGRPLLEVVRHHALHEAVTTALAGVQPQRLEIEIRAVAIPSRQQAVSASGQPIAAGPQPTALSVSVHVQPLPGRPCPGVVLVMHDTTELRRLESLRREFMANVSHELKTPLSSIKAGAETLRNGALADPEMSQKFLARIEEQADRLHHLIMDMLALARIESEQQVFEIVAVDVPEVVAACLEDHRRAAESKGIHLAAESDQPCRVRADREGLRDMLDNLIDNAIKYTPQGGSVSVRWHVEAGGREQGAGSRARGGVSQPGNYSPLPAPGSLLPSARIAVRDTGIGIKPEDQRRVFERFYRVDKARSRELGGTGLGLAIVKHLAQAFGGTVSVESEPGRGSTFTIDLPLANS